MKYYTLVILLYATSVLGQEVAPPDPFDLGDVPAGFFKCGVFHARIDQSLSADGKVRVIHYGFIAKCKQVAKDGRLLFHEWLPTKGNKREDCYKAINKFMDETAKRLSQEYELTGKCSRCPTISLPKKVEPMSKFHGKIREEIG